MLQAGRLKALAFGTGFVAAQLLTCVFFVLVGVAATGANRDNHPDLQVLLASVFALALVGPLFGFAGDLRREAKGRASGLVRCSSGSAN